MGSFATLRAVANRLTKASPEDLPQQIGYLANSITSNCEDLLSASNPEHAVVIHKLRTRTSALLQDRSSEGRLCGIVIAKALVEVGGHALLSESGSWVRNLISCLNKPDPPEVKRLCISTITRIYLLTAEHQQLVREITTPTLPSFITSCLSNIKPFTTKIDGSTITRLSPVLDEVLRSLYLLLHHFAPTIRPNANSIKSICLSLLGDFTCNAHVQQAAENLLARLHYCAPRNTAAADWTQLCSQAIEAAHNTADLIFRAVIEDWTPNIPRVSKVTKKQRSAGIPEQATPGALGLGSWAGIAEGCQRLGADISLINTLVSSPHLQEVQIPLSAILDLTARLSYVLPPTNQFALKNNNEITRDEREELWLNLPHIHVEVLSLFSSLVRTFKKALYPLSAAICQQVWDIFEAEHSNATIREHTYELFGILLEQDMLRITKNETRHYRQLVSCCCDDLIPGHEKNTSAAQTKPGDQKSTVTRLTLEQQSKTTSPSMAQNKSPYAAAHKLLPMLLSHVAWHKLAGGQALRTRLDSTSIFLQHHEAILASVLNPPRASTSTMTATPSLLPFLARTANDAASTSMTPLEQLSYEALLRPRMPAIRIEGDEDVVDAGRDDESMDDEEEVNNIVEPDEVDELPEAPQTQTSHHPIKGDDQHNDTADPDLANTNGVQKRDFTALLEHSANAQLAESATSKKQKIESRLTEAEPLLVETPSVTLPASRTNEVDAEDVPTVSNAMIDTNDAHPGRSTNQVLPSNEISSDDDDFIPPIDVTLNTFTDSEDDDEEG